MFENRVKQRIREGKPTFGLWISLPCPSNAELLASFGMDWLLFDTEHGPATLETTEHLMRAVERSGVLPITRVATNDAAVIKQALDRGAYGVLVPFVSSAAEARTAVLSAKYPPEGIRGVAGTRVNRYGVDLPQYFAAWNEQVLVACQVETAEAVEHIDEIAAVPGLDVVFIGPNDLSANLNVFRQFDHPTFTNAVNRIQQAARTHGVAVGYLASGADETLACIKRGFLFVGAGSDARLLGSAAATLVSTIRAGLGSLAAE